MPSAQTALMPLRRRLNAFIARCHALIGSVCDPYRPELHYMRGPSPKWHAKHVLGTGREQRVARQAASSSSSKKPGSRPGFLFISACPDRGHRPVRRHRAVRR